MKIVRVTVDGLPFYLNLAQVVTFFELDGQTYIGTTAGGNLTVIEEPFEWFLSLYSGYAYYTEDA
jgi:hypothetical protein